MNRRERESSQDAFRDRPSGSQRPLTISVPHVRRDNNNTRPPDRLEHDDNKPQRSEPVPSSSHDVFIENRLPPFSEILPGLRSISDAIGGPLPPLREATTFSPVERSISASPVSAEHDERQRYLPTFQQRQERLPRFRGPTSTTPYPGDLEARHSYQLAPIHGVNVSHIARPSSAHDSAYLSDLSTISVSSSTRGGPPPSHTSTESTASVSSELSRTRVRSWQREQQPGGGQALEGRDEQSGGEAGRFTPTHTEEVEYERRQGHRTRFPVSTMRGGSVGGRGHSLSYGVSSSRVPVPSTRIWEEEIEHDAPSLSGSEHEGELDYSTASVEGKERIVRATFRRPFSGSEPASSSTSPILSEKVVPAHPYADDRSTLSLGSGRRSHEVSYAGWTTQHRTPDLVGDPRRLTATTGFTASHASGSSSGVKDISRTTRYHASYSSTNSPWGNATSSANADLQTRQTGSPRHTSGRVRGADGLSSPQILPYTSLPRYSAGSSDVLPSRSVDPEEVQRAREVPLPPHEGHYQASSAVTAPLPQRSYTFPATSDERGYSYHSHGAPDAYQLRRARPIEPGSSPPPLPLPPPVVSTSSPSRGSSHPYGGPPAPVGAAVGGIEQRDSMLVSPGPTSVPAATRERKGSRDLSRLHPQYAYAQESSHLPRHAQQLSHPFPTSIELAPKAKRSRSASLDRTGRPSTTLVVAGPGSYSTGAPTGGSEVGRIGRGSGRGQKGVAPSSASDSASREESRTPVEPPVFWGRQQRMAQAASLREQPTTSPSMIAPAPRRTAEPPIHPDLLRMSGSAQSEEPTAGPSRASRSLAKKGKGKAEETDLTGVPSDKEVDELHETTDDDSHQHFRLGSSGPSRTGSAGGTRAPRTKIEVACDFCRKRKMKCDGLRPTCKNCQRKGVACSYIPVVRRRGPGKKKKSIEARPKKSNKRVEGEKQTKGKGRDTEEIEPTGEETDAGGFGPEASGGDLQAGGTAFTPPFSSGRTGGLYLPSPLQRMQSPHPDERPETLPAPNISPFASSGLGLPLYPPEQSPSYGRGPRFGGNLFLPGQSPTTRSREIVDPYAGVGMSIPESSDSMMSDVGGHVPIPGAARTASMLSSASGPSSSEGELGRQGRRRRSSKRVRTDNDEQREEGELEEGEIEDGGRP